MALIKCPECGKDVSDRAAACPNCGFPISNTGCCSSNNSVGSTPNCAQIRIVCDVDDLKVDDMLAKQGRILNIRVIGSGRKNISIKAVDRRFFTRFNVTVVAGHKYDLDLDMSNTNSYLFLKEVNQFV